MGKAESDETTRQKYARITAQTDFGQKAQVFREDIDNKVGSDANLTLRATGKALNPVPDTYEYQGSAAIHIYKSEVLGHVVFSEQCCLGSVPELIASQAFENLRGTMEETYTGKRNTRRSGF